MKPYLAVILAASFGGFVGVLAKWTQVPALTASFMRLIIPATVLFIYLKLIKKQKLLKPNWKWMSLGSLLNAVRIFFYFLAWLYIPVSKGIILLYLFPIFFTAFGMIFLKEKLNLKTALLILLAFVGTFLVYYQPNLNFSSKETIGALAMLAEAIIFSLAMIIFKKQGTQYSEVETVFWQNIVGGLALIPIIIFTGLNAPIKNVLTIGLYTGVITGLIGFLLFFYGLKRLKTSHYSLMTYFEVVAGMIFAVWFLKETLTFNMAFGDLMIIAAGIGLILLKQTTNKNIQKN